MDGALPTQGTTPATKARLSLHLTNGLGLIHTPKGFVGSTADKFWYELADNALAECWNKEALGVSSKSGTTLNNSTCKQNILFPDIIHRSCCLIKTKLLKLLNWQMAVPNDLSLLAFQQQELFVVTQMATSNANAHFPTGSMDLNQPRTGKLLKVLLHITKEYLLQRHPHCVLCCNLITPNFCPRNMSHSRHLLAF